MSICLFNAASEMVMRRWKAKFTNHGFKIACDETIERLTNVRFADDLIIYACSLEEFTEMLDLLVEEFRIVGLEFNAKKSKSLLL